MSLIFLRVMMVIFFRIILTHPLTRSKRFPLPLTTKNRPYYLNRIKPHFTDKVSGNGRWSFSVTSKPRSRPSASVTSPLLLRTECSNGNWTVIAMFIFYCNFSYVATYLHLSGVQCHTYAIMLTLGMCQSD